MATARCTQACFHAAGTHAVLPPQGECWEREVEGQGWRHHPGISGVRRTVPRVDGGCSTLVKTEAQIHRACWRRRTQTGKLSVWEACEDRAAGERAASTCQENIRSKLLYYMFGLGFSPLSCFISSNVAAPAETSSRIVLPLNSLL